MFESTLQDVMVHVFAQFINVASSLRSWDSRLTIHLNTNYIDGLTLVCKERR